MQPVLDTLIDRFRKAQDIAVDTLIHRLNIPQPETNRAWPSYCAENWLHQTRELNGIGIYAHGYGVELKIDGFTIDFDWGANGEPDGFDGWRLHKFNTENPSEIVCSHNDVNDWLKQAHVDGKLIKEGSLYYDPSRRARMIETPRENSSGKHVDTQLTQEQKERAFDAIKEHPLYRAATSNGYCVSTVKLKPSKPFFQSLHWKEARKTSLETDFEDSDTILIITYIAAPTHEEALLGNGSCFEFILHPKTLAILHTTTSRWVS